MSAYAPLPREKWQPVKDEDRARMRDQAAKDYEAGSSIRAVADHLSQEWGHVSFGLAWDLLHEAEVPMRSRHARAPRTP
ncbi:helix-turn-helix domain-containing protein [Streptomyces tendae]|uniref:helix-turn-helix domain-containing protein n=1 Tax=Streptomyces tendae TaxID=1932 RepID=UPI003418A199